MTADARRAFILNQADGTSPSSTPRPTSSTPSHPTEPTTQDHQHYPCRRLPIWADFAPLRKSWSSPTRAMASLRVRSASSAFRSARSRSADQPQLRSQQPRRCRWLRHRHRHRPRRRQPHHGQCPRRMAPGPTSPTQAIQSGFAARQRRQPLGNCTVSVINLDQHTVPTHPSARRPTSLAPLTAIPSISPSTTGSPTGKVYVISTDSNFMSVIRTDIDQLHAIFRSREAASLSG